MAHPNVSVLRLVNAISNHLDRGASTFGMLILSEYCFFDEEPLLNLIEFQRPIAARFDSAHKSRPLNA